MQILPSLKQKWAHAFFISNATRLNKIPKFFPLKKIDFRTFDPSYLRYCANVCVFRGSFKVHVISLVRERLRNYVCVCAFNKCVWVEFCFFLHISSTFLLIFCFSHEAEETGNHDEHAVIFEFPNISLCSDIWHWNSRALCVYTTCSVFAEKKRKYYTLELLPLCIEESFPRRLHFNEPRFVSTIINSYFACNAK